MKQRPSTSIFSIPFSPLNAQTGEQIARSLRWQLVSLAGIGAIAVLAGVGYVGVYTLRRSMVGSEDTRVENAASLSKQLVDRVLDERSRQVELIASTPTVIVAAKTGRVSQSPQVDEARRYVGALQPKLDIVEVMLTDRSGYDLVTTAPSSHVVQSDESWWQAAWASPDEPTTALAMPDSATHQPVVELAAAVKDGATRVGVVRVKFGLSVVDSVLAQGAGAGSAIRVDLVDPAGKVIASSTPTARFKTFGGPRAGAGVLASIIDARNAGVFSYTDEWLPQRAVAVVTNGGRWHVVAHMSKRDASRAYVFARSAVIAGVGVALVVILACLMFVGRFVERCITGPAEELAIAAEAVAAGDLSKQVGHIRGNHEIGRLARAVGTMIDELRRLAAALSHSTAETTTMTADITASSEEMSASAGQIAHTASALSQQANVMAETIQALAGASEQLVTLTSELDTGAHEEVERNAQLRTLALQNRARLDDSTSSLGQLSDDVEASAASIERLAQASEEVRTFVTLVQKLARQSKLLALNAAMEAARAGEHGHGFAVVAEEVRRLAAMSSEAAERTERVVSGVLNGIAQTRSTSERTVTTVRAVREATEQGSRSFGQIETVLADADRWTTSIERTVGAATTLTRETRAKLDSLAAGTESFAAAMEEVAASSEEQSASTEQIASAAGTLSGAADRLCRLVANLRWVDAPGQDQASAARVGGEAALPVRPPVNSRVGRLTPIHTRVVTNS